MDRPPDHSHHCEMCGVDWSHNETELTSVPRFTHAWWEKRDSMHLCPTPGCGTFQFTRTDGMLEP